MWLYGASGHGKVIKEILEAQHRTVDGFIDDDLTINELSGLPVLHSTDHVDEMIVSVGANSTRRDLVEKKAAKIAEAAVHPSSVVSVSAQLGAGTVVMAGTVINADARIGRHCIINTGSSVDHECVLGDYTHISPGAHLCGQVHVGEGSFIGVGSSVIPCVHIGKWCVIGAGSVVVSDIPDGYLAYGNPCKLVKRI